MYLHEWKVVKVDIDGTDPERALQLREYRCHFYIRQHRDAETMNQHECRYWPELRESGQPGSIGRYHPVAPAKADGYMSRQDVRWCEDTVCISEDRMAGPFDFISVKIKGKLVSHRVPDEAWSELEENAISRGMEVQSIRQIAPLIR